MYPKFLGDTQALKCTVRQYVQGVGEGIDVDVHFYAIHFLNKRELQYLFRGAVGQDASLVHQQDPVAELGRQINIVCYKQGGFFL